MPSHGALTLLENTHISQGTYHLPLPILGEEDEEKEEEAEEEEE